jgi:DNA-binding NarL/FixJ family response regulator
VHRRNRRRTIHAIGLKRPSEISDRSCGTAAPIQPTPSALVTQNPSTQASKIRECVLAENELVREALCRVLGTHENIHMVAGLQSGALRETARLPKEAIDVLVLLSRESLAADLEQILLLRTHAPTLKILLISSVKEDSEFLQYVRAGISGYLWPGASAKDVAQGIENVHAGKAVCPGELCAALFRFFEDAEPRLPFGSPTQRLGLTRREQQK